MLYYPSSKAWGAVLVAALATALGCVSNQTARTPPPVPETAGIAVEEINLLAVPVALNLDGIPGIDGFVIKIFASSRKRPKPMPIEKGKIEVAMFDGMPGRTTDAGDQPLRTWTFSVEQLKPLEIQSSIGVGYQVAALWGDKKPKSNKITVAVRYTSPDGKEILSAPSIISVALK